MTPQTLFGGPALSALCLCAILSWSTQEAAGREGESAAGCDASLWNHVWDPPRLRRVNACITATGIVDQSTADDDGDQHFLLKLDPGQDKLLNKRNKKKKNGDLVAEIVCANRVKVKKAKAACSGYVNQIPVPALGAHVKVTGTYVIDTHNGWAEIHPVSQIQVIK